MTSRSTTGRFHLARYVAVLALDSGHREAFLRSPRKQMLAAGLDDDEICLLSGTEFQDLLRHLQDFGPKPAPDEQIGDD